MGKKQSNIGKDIIGKLPIVSELTKQFTTAVGDMENAAINVAKQFGQGRENILNIKAALTDATDSLTAVGVSITQAISIAGKLQTDFSKAIGRNSMLTSESFGKLHAMTEATGQNLVTITTSFADAGMSVLQAGEEMQKVVNSSRAIGVDTEKVSSMVLSNLSKTTQFNFQNGVEGMAKMAAQAVNLRIDMDKTLVLADKLFDPEQAIDMASAMQRLGVQQSALLDPLKLMDLAQNDPAELQNQIAEMSKEFVRLNEKGQFEIMPGAKRQLMEISQQLGFGKDGLGKMALASAELEDKMSKIKLPDNFSEDQKKFIANMATMDAGGEYKLKVDGKDMGLDKAIDLFNKDKTKLDKFMEAQAEKSMEDLAREQIDIFTRIDRNIEGFTNIAYRAGTALGSTKASEDLAQGRLTVSSAIPSIFAEGNLTAKNLRQSAETGLNDVTSALKEGDLAGAAESIIGNMGGFFETTVKGVVDRSEETIKKILDSKNEGVKILKGAVAGGLEIVENLTGADLKSKQILESNKDLKEATVKPNINAQEKLNNVTTSKSENTTPNKSEITYSGKIDLNINAPAGMSENDWKSLSDKLTNDVTFKEWLMNYINNPTGNKNPNEVNRSLNSVNR
jgi:hypothetical protein